MLQLGIETATLKWLRNSKQRGGMTRTGRLIDLNLSPCWYLELPTFGSFDTFQSSQFLYFSTRRRSRPRFLWLLINSLLIREAAFGVCAVASLSQRTPNAERSLIYPFFCHMLCDGVLWSSVSVIFLGHTVRCYAGRRFPAFSVWWGWRMYTGSSWQVVGFMNANQVWLD